MQIIRTTAERSTVEISFGDYVHEGEEFKYIVLSVWDGASCREYKITLEGMIPVTKLWRTWNSNTSNYTYENPVDNPFGEDVK